MYRFVSMHGIAVLASFGELDHAKEDMAIFDIQLDEKDMADIKALQTSKQTCADCFTKECQACATVLQKSGCPIGSRIPVWGRDNPDSAECMACAAKHNETIAKVCGPQYMVSKACGTAGGFPR